MERIDRLTRQARDLVRPRAAPWFKRAVALAAVAFVAITVTLKLTRDKDYVYWIREDGPVESATSVVYFVATLLALQVSGVLRRSGRRNEGRLYLVLALAFLFVAGEEISWGQRILGLHAPGVFHRRNYQREINVHNFATSAWVHSAYIVAAGYGAAMSSIVPLVCRKQHCERVKLFVPDRFLAPYFIPAFFLFGYFEYVSPLLVARYGERFGWGKGHFLLAKDQEPAELLLSLGFLVFVALTCLRLAEPTLRPKRSSHPALSPLNAPSDPGPH